jgi:hypothetical protein
MDPTIVLATLLAVVALALLPRIVRRVRFVRLVNKIPGPPAYPIIGSLLPLLLAPRNSKYDCDLELLSLELLLPQDPFRYKSNNHSHICCIRIPSDTINQLQSV